MTSIVLEPYGKDHEAGLRQQLDAAGILNRQDGVGYFWRQLIDEPYRRNSAVIVARQGEMIVGIGVVMCRAYGRPEGRCSMIIVFEDWRRQGIGTRLKEAADRHMAEAGMPLHYAMLYEGQEDALPFLEATGFREVCKDIVIAWNGGDYSYTPVEGVHCREYRGGDPVLNAKIAEFQNKAFVRETMVPHLTADSIEGILSGDGHWMMVAVEVATDEVVGVTECTDNALFPSISVARRYWAKGLAEWIGGLSLDRYIAAGIDKPWTIARPENRASIAYLKRMNWHPVSHSITYASPTGAAPADASVSEPATERN